MPPNWRHKLHSPGKQVWCHCGHSFRTNISWCCSCSPLHKKLPLALAPPSLLSWLHFQNTLLPTPAVFASGERTLSGKSTGPMKEVRVPGRQKFPPSERQNISFLCTYYSCPYFQIFIINTTYIPKIVVTWQSETIKYLGLFSLQIISLFPINFYSLQCSAVSCL